MKPVVTHIIQHLQPGGIETLVVEMLKLDGMFDVHVIALEGTKTEALIKFPILMDYTSRVHCLNKAAGVQWITARQLRNKLNEIQADVCISHHIGPLLYTSMAKIGLKVSHTHVEHDAWHLDEPKRERLQHWCLKMSNPTVVADADLVADILTTKFPDIKPYVIHNGIDTDRFIPGSTSQAREKLDLPQDKRFLGCAARLEPVKRIYRLINALVDLPEDVHLAIAGEGSERLPLMLQAIKLELTDRVHFLGYMTDLETFYQAIDLFCLVSQNEGFPLSVLEAQACDTPVVVSNVGGSKEAVCPQTGLLLLSDDAVQLTNAIKLQLMRSYETSPRDFIIKNNSIKSMNEKYECLIEHMMLLSEVA